MRHWRCCNPNCSGRTGGPLDGYSFFSPKRVCPECGASENTVVAIATHHLIVPNNEGPIVGLFGTRHAIACNPTRTLASLHGVLESATAEWSAVTCRKCLSTDAWRKLLQERGQPFLQQINFDMMVPGLSPEVQAVLDSL